MEKQSLLRQLLKPHWKALTIAFIAVLVEGAADLLEPWPIKIAIDYVINAKPLPGRLSALINSLIGTQQAHILAFAAGMVVCVAMMGAVASFVEKYLTINVGQWIMLDLRRLIFGHLQRLSLSYYDRAKTGDLISRVTSDVDAVQSFVSSALLGIVIDLVTLIGMVGVMFYLNWHFTLIAISIIPILFFEVYRLTRSIKRATRSVRKKEGEVVSVVQETLSSIRLVKAFGRENYQEDRLKTSTLESIKMAFRARNLKARLSSVVDVLVAIGTCVVLWYGAKMVLTNQLTSGELVLFLLYLRMMYKPIRDLSKMSDTASKAMVGAERINEIIKTNVEVAESPNSRVLTSVKGEVQLQDLFFCYNENEPVLNGINLTIKPGQFAAIVGPTGSGKSTIVNLIPRFYDPISGSVKIDGEDIRNFTIESLRRQIGFVLQDAILFHTTIAENIAYGKPDATQEEIYQAAKLANALEFIEKMPDGFETMVGERGVTLSGGQRQRLAIARAIIRNAGILILDEPTSGLDLASEELVLSALENLRKDKTTIAIAHRLATVRNADIIFVVKDGSIIESGTDQELLKNNGFYAHLHEIQSREAEMQTLLE